MNHVDRFLSVFGAVILVVIGLYGLLPIVPVYLPPSWVVVYSVLPDGAWWIYPGAFVVAGLILILGIWKPTAFIGGFQLAAYLFFVWGLAGVWGFITEGTSTPPGFLTNFFVAVLIWVVVHLVTLVRRLAAVNEKVRELEPLLPRPVESPPIDLIHVKS